jgi:hypothetical protein
VADSAEREKSWLGRSRCAVALAGSIPLPYKGESIMELTEEMLKRIANNIADLRLKFSLVRHALIQLGVNSQELDRATSQAQETLEFQRIRDHILEQLKGGH